MCNPVVQRADVKALLGRLYNRYDYLIRFFYCRLPVIRDLIKKFLANTLYHSDDQGLHEKFIEISELLDEHHFDLSNKRVLEVGPGDSTALASNFLKSGVKKYIMVDRFPRLRENHPVIKRKRIRFFRNDITDMGNIESGSVDLIIGVAVLEHIRDVKKAFSEMNRVLNPSGLMIHYVDMRDHYDFEQPLKFLKYSDFVWDSFLTREGYSYTNRLRIDDYMKIIRAIGFEMPDIRRIVGEDPHKIALNRRFRNKSASDLSVLQAVFVLRKPALLS